MSKETTNSDPKVVQSHYVTIEGLKIHYLEAGEGEAVLLLHGFPTSSHLWRNVMPQIAATHRVIALDLPGFGHSAKPLSASYSFKFFNQIISSFLEKLGIQEINLGVHDLGGPIGLLWAVQNPTSIKRLILLNTLVYADFSWAVVLFGIATRLPLTRGFLSSPRGIAASIRFGMVHKQKLTPESIPTYTEPFVEKQARKALLKTVSNLSSKGFEEIAEKLPLFKVPVQGIYGVQDKILPKIKNTMERVQKDLPQMEITPIPNCGHFLQEDEPQLVGQLIHDFLNKKS